MLRQRLTEHRLRERRIRRRDDGRRADRPEPLAASANTEGTLTPSSMREPVRHLGELLGALSITKKPGESITATEEKLVRDLAMQVAGLYPVYVDADSIPEADLSAKKAELLADESLAQKPENIRAQIVEGQLKKWFAQVCLYDQPFRDEERTVGELITERIATIGENIRVRRFTRYALGEEL